MMQPAALALGQDVVERFLKGRLSVAAAYREFSVHSTKAIWATQIETIDLAFRYALMIYHATVAWRKPDDDDIDDWVASFGVDGTSLGVFRPFDAPGYVSSAHKAATFDCEGDDTGCARFSDGALGRLETLFTMLSVDLTPPDEPCFPDWRVEQLRAENVGILSSAQAEYLQSLPVMDHDAEDIRKGLATACELNVRSRVEARLSELFGSNAIGADCLREIAKHSKRHEEVFEEFLLTQLENGEWSVKSDFSPLLSALIAFLRGEKRWVETTCSDQMLRALCESTFPERFTLRSHTQDASTRFSIGDILPCVEDDCRIEARVEAIRIDRMNLIGRRDGRNAAWPWYTEWRVDKDRLLYDYAPIFPSGLPVFFSVSSWCWDELPLPNRYYGDHIIVWDPASVGLNRSVFVLGYLGAPRRSALLLLQDLLSGTPRKDGTETPEEELVEKLMLLERLLLQLSGSAQPSHDTAAKQWQCLAETKNRLFSRDNPRYDLGDHMNIEYHVFGPVKLSTAIGALLCLDEGGATEGSEPTQREALVESVARRSSETRFEWALYTYNVTDGQEGGASVTDYPMTDVVYHRLSDSARATCLATIRRPPSEDAFEATCSHDGRVSET